MLGTFTWELKPDESTGEILCRPIFMINESFAKDFRVKRQKVSYFPNLAPNEEVNFSKLAIKFTRSLTKDMVFSSVRDIMRKIGEFISRDYQLEVPFSFGALIIKNRRIKFVFDYSRFAQVSLHCISEC
jgi:hypothetical protein